MKFTQQLRARSIAADSMLCVGLDPDVKRFPACITGREAIFEFCRAIVDATAPFDCAFKPQIAYLASESAEDALVALIAYIHEKHPDIPVILDEKRGDIGSTAKHYALEAFERFKADAVTLSPYMGGDTIEPFLEYEEKGIFLLCRTSNPGGADIEELVTEDGLAVFEHVARLSQSAWNKTGELGLVAGATRPDEIRRIRAQAPSLPLLMPGIGAQGGDVNAAVAAGLDADGWGMVINSSRAVLYAGTDENFESAAAEAARRTRDAIRNAKALVSASR